MVKIVKHDYQSIDEVTDMWNILTKDQLDYLKANYEVQNYKKNEVIYCEGDTPTHVLCVVKGKVKIYRTGVGGRSQIVRMVKPFEMLAYRAMFAGENFVTSACAFEPSVIYAIPREVIYNLVSKNRDLSWYFIKQLSVDLGIADKRAVSLTQKHIRGRLAESLVFLLDNYGVEADGATISIYLSREDLANLSNMTTSNAIRTLSTFVQEKIIAMDGRKIKVIDEETLRRISKLG
ncbi:MAG: Crp/Fnr family transcriptional regulator [Bacteroidales bacterium]|nr:Crp/Fnr family transcriptional regulator [Candidatus Physcocola equi]